MDKKKSKPQIIKKISTTLDIPDLLHLTEKYGIIDFEWQKGDERIRFSKKNLNQTESNSLKKETTLSSVESLPNNQKKITSKFVGTFYRASRPNEEPYVKVGSLVKVGDPVGIVDAMKLLTEIESEYAGKILQILVQNGQTVQFGDHLFTIEE